MKLNKISLLMMGGLMAASCSDIDDQWYEGGTLSQEQLQGVMEVSPERQEAIFSGMYSIMIQPYTLYNTYFGNQRADDFGFGMMALSQDAEGADLHMADNNYNWFSTCGELSSRNADYANPFERYVMPYLQIGMANDVLAMFPEDTKDTANIYKMAQARAIRAFDYMSLAPYFQFGYSVAKDKPCVLIFKEDNDPGNNPRATVEEVYKTIIEDLDWAIEHLEGFDRGTDKGKININVAYGLRARAYLAMGDENTAEGRENFKKAAEDALKAMDGFTPASIAELGAPRFCNMAKEDNWMWGLNVTEDMVSSASYPTVASWISPFSWNGYAAATGNSPMINILLYNKISDNDVRKGWWLNDKLESPLMEGLQWATAAATGGVPVKGNDIATWVDPDGNKIEYQPYTNVKFGMKAGIGSTVNSNDWPMMRVEEMILVRCEGLLKSGDEATAKSELEKFVSTYRMPGYTVPSTRSLADEIWFQRRVELWGEGFFTSDMKRLNKPMVRFHEGKESNVADAFRFNMEANDGWLNMRFPQREMDQNMGIVDNTEGSQPVPGQNGQLRDGVTD